MPSPFPGMDPFLENPAIFPDLHDSWITYLRETLNAQLPEPYYAGIASRVWVETVRRPIGPDVNVLRPVGTVNGGGPVKGRGGIAVADAVRTEPVVIHVPYTEVREEIREVFLEIYAQPGGERIVTTVEVLSPTNKTPGEQGRDQYRQKQREVLRSQVHLVEIDLLRGGTHVTAVPLHLALEQAGAFDYHVCIHRFDRQEDYLVYPIQLSGRLPVLAIPLLPGDADVRIDLRTVLNRCYDSGRYGRRAHYRDLVTVPPLLPEQAAWAERLLHEKGILVPPH